MSKPKFLKMLSSLFIFALPVITLARTYLLDTPIEINENSVAIKEDIKSSNATTLTTDTHDHSSWSPISSGGLTLTTGNYYVLNDVSASNRIDISEGATVNLCLNGYTLSFSSDYGIYIANYYQGSNTSLTIYDCSEEETGKISLSKSSTIYAIYAICPGGSSNNSINITINGGSIEARASSFYGYGIYGTTRPNTSNCSINITMNGGNVTATGFGSSGIYVYNNNSSSNSIDITIAGGTITSASNQAYGIFIYTQYSSNCSIDLTMSGGTLSSTSYSASYSSYGIYSNNDGSSNCTFDAIINGGYHSYQAFDKYQLATLVVNAGYFTNAAYSAISSYIPSTSLLWTYSSTEAALLVDEEYNSSYPNAIYVNGSVNELSVPDIVCYGTDVEQFITITTNSSSYSYSYTGTESGSGSLPSAIGTYSVVVSFNEHVSSIGYAPKEHYGAGSVTFDLTIADHTPSNTYSYNDTHHWRECTNTYCDQEYVDASGYGEHNMDNNSCLTCDYTLATSTTDPTDPSDPSGTTNPGGDQTSSTDLTWLYILLGVVCPLVVIGIVVGLIFFFKKKKKKNKTAKK